MAYRISALIALPLLVFLAWPAAGICQTSKLSPTTKSVSANANPASPTSKPAKPPITVSKETTWITEPLNADGTVNYVAAADAWLSKGVTRENNAAILILQAFGRDALVPKLRDAIIKRLGLTDFLDANTALAGALDYVHSNFASDDVDQALTDLKASIKSLRDAPFDARTDVTQVAAYVKRNDRALDLLVEASSRPRYYVPYVSPSNPPRMMDCLMRVSFRGWFSVNEALTSRGALRAREGKFDAAMQDLAAARRLGRLIQQETSAINAMVGMAVERFALETMIGLATSGRLDKKQSRALLAVLTQTHPMPMPGDFDETIDRYFSLDYLTSWARDGLEMAARFGLDIDLEPEVTVPDVNLDYDLLLRLHGESCAKATEAESQPTFRARDKARKALSTPATDEVKVVLKNHPEALHTQARMAALIKRVGTGDPQRLTRLMHEMLVCSPQIVDPAGITETTRAWAMMARLSAALAVYRAENGIYPEKLNALAPGIIPAVPTDPFNNKPLTYRLTEKGYILYSVGKDMKDDGGKMDESRSAPDLVVEAK